MARGTNSTATQQTTGAVVSSTAPAVRGGRRSRSFEWAFFGLALPGLAIYVGFLLGPTLAGFYFSLTRWDGINSPVFIGFDNFIQLSRDPQFAAAILHTLLFALVILVGQTVIGLALALLLNRAGRRNSILRGIFFAPSILSTAVVALLWGFIFNPLVGPLPAVASFLGIKDSSVSDLLGHQQTALVAVSLVVVWEFAGYMMVIFIAGLKNIPMEVYEAASIDGASGWRRFWAITWPLLAPSTSVALTISLAGNLRLFDQVYLLTGGGPAGATATVGTLIYQTAFTNSNFGYSVTQSVILTILIALVVVGQRALIARRTR